MNLRILVSAAAFAAASAVASAETFVVGSDQIQLDPGPLYCFVNERESEFDRLMLQHQRSANRGLNVVLAIFMECEALKAHRNGIEEAHSQYGILTAPLAKDGSPQKFPGRTRAVVLDMLKQVMAEGVTLDAANVQSRIDNAANSVGIGTVQMKMGEMRQLGALLLDETALYLGIAITYEIEGESKVMAGVLALTLVEDYVFQLSLYREFSDMGTVKKLLGDQTELMRKFVSQN